MVKSLVRDFNGITMAYAMALVNATLALLLAFGLTLSPDEQASITTFINAALVVLAHVGHRLGEQQQATSDAVPAAPPAQTPAG